MAVLSYKCPNCGGGLIFSPSSQKFLCEYCMSEFDEEQLKEMEPESAVEEQAEDEEAKEGQNDGEAGPVLYICPSCGAQIVTDATTAASFCYYCHNPVVLSKRLGGEFQPDYVVPFQIDRKKAEEIFSQWIGKKRFVPDAFYNKHQIEMMSGIYFPYWVYGCRVSGDYEAQGSRIRVWEAAGMRYTETKVYDISRQGDMDVDFVTRNALRKANRKLVDNVLPYRLEERKDFHEGYLAGFMAENRDMEKQEFVSEVQSEIRSFALSNLDAQAAGYTNVRVNRREIQVSEEEWHFALLPVWTMTYKDKADGKIYYFALNGQTGKTAGELPVDKRKLGMLFVSVFLPLFILMLIGGYFIG